MSVIKEGKGVAEELVRQIEASEHSWDAAYRHALARNVFCRWMSTPREESLAEWVANSLSERLGYTGDESITLDWYREESERTRQELIDSQQVVADGIEDAKARLEDAGERKKAAQAAIDQGHTTLRHLSRELKKPFVFPLPMNNPNRQRDLPLADGEEWRSVLLADVLTGDISLKSLVAEKLGNVTLQQYASLAQQHGGEKPKKLTRKQWDKVEEIVQAWHKEQGL